MDMPKNLFKQAILEGRHQTGLWCTLADAYATELCAGAGFEWLLLDSEHSPSDPVTMLPLLQAAAAHPVTSIVRPAWNDTVLIKRYLDIGAQSLLIPFVQNAEEAASAVAATRYPPKGVRGVSSVSRATQFGRIQGYQQKADDEICVLVQVETEAAIDQIEAICAVEGVDGVFIGPNDLAASMGYLGRMNEPAPRKAVIDGIKRIRAAGKPAGVLTPDPAFAKQCIEAGSLFTAVGVDAGMLAKATDALKAEFLG